MYFCVAASYSPKIIEFHLIHPAVKGCEDKLPPQVGSQYTQHIVVAYLSHFKKNNHIAGNIF